MRCVYFRSLKGQLEIFTSGIRIQNLHAPDSSREPLGRRLGDIIVGSKQQIGNIRSISENESDSLSLSYFGPWRVSHIFFPSSSSNLLKSCTPHTQPLHHRWWTLEISLTAARSMRKQAFARATGSFGKEILSGKRSAMNSKRTRGSANLVESWEGRGRNRWDRYIDRQKWNNSRKHKDGHSGSLIWWLLSKPTLSKRSCQWDRYSMHGQVYSLGIRAGLGRHKVVCSTILRRRYQTLMTFTYSLYRSYCCVLTWCYHPAAEGFDSVSRQHIRRISKTRLP